MKKKNLKFIFFLQDFIHAIENHQPSFSLNFSILCHLVHFLQILSYFVKSDSLDYNEPKLLFLSKIFYYSNFINVLSLFNSNILTSIVLYSVLALISLMNLVFILIFLLKRIFGLNSISTLRYMPHFLRLIVIFITLFY